MDTMELEHLFSPGKIGNVKIKNRIIRSATWVAKATKLNNTTAMSQDSHLFNNSNQMTSPRGDETRGRPKRTHPLSTH